jgi:hypothetical protein
LFTKDLDGDPLSGTSLLQFRAAVVRLLSALAAATLLMNAVWAAAATRPFEIRSAFVEPSQHVYVLNARLDFELPEGAQLAIQDGVPLTLALDIVVNRQRRIWFDDTVASLEQRYEVVYHALSERYLVRNVNSGEQASYDTLASALESLTHIERLPVLDQSLISPQLRYEVSLRAWLDVHNIPEPLRFILFWVSDWRQQTDWYTWPLKF